MIQRLNQIRRENPALQRLDNVGFLDTAERRAHRLRQARGAQRDHHRRQPRPPPRAGGPRAACPTTSALPPAFAVERPARRRALRLARGRQLRAPGPAASAPATCCG